MREKKWPIAWYEGMPLEPAVFQQDFLYKQYISEKVLKNIQKEYFGIINLEWNDLSITNGILQIKSIECILPDLTYCNIENDNNLTIDLKEKNNELKKSNLFVYITIPDNHLAYDSNTAQARYRKKEISVVDITNKEDANISVLEGNFKLMLSPSLPIGFVGLPLCEITFTGISYEFTDFSGPILKISNSPAIHNRVSELIKSAKDKILYLASKNDDSIMGKLQISSIAQIIFPLERIVLGNESPYTLYSSLVNAIAPAIIFETGKTLPMLNNYDHYNPINSINPLLEFIENMLDKIKQAYKSTKLEEREGLFATVLSKTEGNYITIGLVKPENIETSALIKWAQNAIIATEDKMVAMQDQRLKGAEREYIQEDDILDLKAPDNTVLIRIKNDPKFITANKMLCILNFDSNIKPEKITIFHSNLEA
jgi:type VI secretion system protein ImpJ